MQELTQKGTLDDLPIFDRFPMPDKQHDHAAIFELALITLKTTPHTQPPYQIQESGGVIGRNPKGTVIYLAPKMMITKGKVCVYPDGIREISVPNIESYLIVECGASKTRST